MCSSCPWAAGCIGDSSWGVWEVTECVRAFVFGSPMFWLLGWHWGARWAEVGVVVFVYVCLSVLGFGIKWCRSRASFFAGFSRVIFVWCLIVLWGWSAGYLCLRSSLRLGASVAHVIRCWFFLQFWWVLRWWVGIQFLGWKWVVGIPV